MEIRKKLGQQIKQARQRAGLSQLDVALEMGFTNHYLISKIEKGVESLPPRHLPLVSKLLNIEQGPFLVALIEMKTLAIHAEVKRNGQF